MSKSASRKSAEKLHHVEVYMNKKRIFTRKFTEGQVNRAKKLGKRFGRMFGL
jgi:hypothetical protein